MDIEKLSQELESAGLELVIGLETHIRLNTRSKLFCTCPNEEASEPNVHICAVCTGQMGVLPAINQEAIRKAIRFGKAINSSFKNEVIHWDRKHYEYPDLPKNFQLTQFQKPIIPDGLVECFRDNGTAFQVEIEQVHIEEDAAKLMHERKQTLVDFNKGGVPLIEVVTKPVIRHIRDAATYAQYLQRIVQTLGISEANLEKGEFKSDVSVSLRKAGSSDLNPRTEIKNLNSFKFMVEALCEEISKQLAYFQEHGDFRPDQTTVLFDEALKQTKTMRKKEFAADYRYAVEPDIPFVDIKEEVVQIQIDEKLLPFAIESNLIKGGVRPQDAKFFTSDPARSSLFLAINEKVDDTLFVAKTLLNNLKAEDYEKVSKASDLAEMFAALKAEKITVILLQQAIEQWLQDADFDYKAFFADHSIDDSKIDHTIADVIAQNKTIAEEIKSGNQGKAGILVGKVLQVIGKGASGKLIREKILAQLSGTQQTSQSDQKETIGEKQSRKEQEEEMPSRFTEIVVKDQYRTHANDEITEALLGQEVVVAGWVASVRDHGDLVFVDLRDNSYEVLQIRLDRQQFPHLDDLSRLKPESVIMTKGTIIKRAEDDFNAGIKTGELELNALALDVLNAAKTLPFEIKRADKTNENVRFKYKFLDHRSAENRRAIINRHKVIKMIRDVLDQEEFIEVETPILTAGTDEGAREFIVPSRKFPGKFYTLPQAPQQFKQMLMVGGFEKYFQIARCFRDEDSRGDRQPEFTQLDIEMAFVSMQDIIDVNTHLFNTLVKEIYGNKWKLFPFQVLTYAEAMEKYGTDRPDLRFGLELKTITEIVRETEFQVFAKPIEEGGIVKCIKVPGSVQKTRLSKGQIEKLTAIAQEHGLGGLAYIIVNEDELQSPIIKFLGEDICAKIIEETEAQVGDIVFFSAADAKTANKALDAVRQELGKILKLVKPKELHPAWIIDFPFFELTDEGNWTFTHNPFSMPSIADLDKHMKGENIGEIIAQQYDMVLNGYEIGGGSVRAHKSEILEATYRNMGYNKEEMKMSVGHMYEAFQYGAPPHGGIAWGVDRLMMILEKKNSIREVMAFPKTGSGEDLMFNSPSKLSEKKILEANIKSTAKQ
ncbi:bifunctional amidotransferase subunit GatB/aspartate--tRNA ligase AspS [Marinilongibacter aquaticus]|uniref:bifunctional amidotransferase subunit GatB/aspartate--tRNA ligase AspS n=1 Tax=Marinilongibacter aquaticus TaxID=2975157 RepID=UPI0021BD9CAB|nr:bifunctional amidotransferase subunit GatB/aspartate--tRNA ligase AspS [Marinilongibacter aquaticus]UBM58977.1 bifunctional amidotransferase subunit GatB/aspartate--tRNA ligase AspS [Marinilongibacter aquaticus]